MAYLSMEENDGVAVCTFDMQGSSQNVLNREFFDELEQLLLNNSYYGMPLVFVSAKKDFLAGADVERMAGISREDARKMIEKAHEIFARLAARATRTVAAIHGQCLGGGLEFALACSMRIVTEESRLGFPEVKLGIIPGFGGTQRLPRLIGFSEAAQMIVSGHSISAEKARRIGLVDEVAPDRAHVLERALALARGCGMPERKKKTFWFGNLYTLGVVALGVAKKVNVKHYPAPFQAIETLMQTARKPNYGVERDAVCNLLVSPAAQNLIRLFLLTSRAKKKWPNESKVKRTAVIGAGIMGSGIAYAFSRAGFSVRLIEKDQKKLVSALRTIQGLLNKDVARKRLKIHEASAALDRVSPSSEFLLGPVDLAIEAVFEDYAVKQEVLKRVEQCVSTETVIATNTSSLSVQTLAGMLQHPERFLGMHFFNPADKMPLVELVRSGHTEWSVIQEAGAVAKQLGKVPVLAPDKPGFIVNRVLADYFDLAIYGLKDATPDLIDEAMREFGMPMGPFELADQVGLDVLLHAQKNILPGADAGILETMAAKGFFGKKTGMGFYDWTGKERKINPYVLTLGLKVQKRKDKKAIKEGIRTVLSSVLRGAARALAASREDVELAMVLGAGWPPFRRLLDDIKYIKIPAQ